MRNKMVKIPSNYSHRNVINYCICGEKEDMEHLYTCNLFNQTKSEIITQYKSIYTDNVSEQVKVLRRFENQFLEREKLLNDQTRNPHKKFPPCDPLKDPLFSACNEYCNGNG